MDDGGLSGRIRKGEMGQGMPRETWGFIGAGNMAGAIIRGIVAVGHAAPAEILVHDVSQSALDALVAEVGVQAAASNTEVVERCSAVVLAVKPQVLRGVVDQIRDQVLVSSPLVVSIAAGTPLEVLESWLSPDVAIVRAMPNLNVAVRCGMAAIAGNKAASAAQVAQVVGLFEAVGEAVVIPETMFRPFTAIAGSSPAWTFLYIDALARAAVAQGMPKAQALAVAAQAVRGSAALVAEGKAHPWELIDQVCSPGGTTIAGLGVLEERGMAAALRDAVAATITRDQQISAAQTTAGQR